MPLSALLRRASLPAPQLDPHEALSLLQAHYGLTGQVEPLGSQQDLNFLVHTDSGRFVLKVCRGDYSALELEAQHAALALLREAGLPVPAVQRARNGRDLISTECAGQAVQIRLFEYLEGQPLTQRPHLSAALMARMGDTAARVGQALAGFEHPGLTRTLQWDPRHAQALIEHLLPAIPEARRDAVASACKQAALALAPLIADLPEQAVHLDITDDNTLWQRDADRHWQLSGVIDFGDLIRTWRIADLSVTCAALLHHGDTDPMAMLSAVSAYHARQPLQAAELKALWPLIVLRACVLVASSARQLQLDPDNRYIQGNVDHEWQIFDLATQVPMAFMEAMILDAVGLQAPVAPLKAQAMLPAIDGLVAVDLSVLSPRYEAGNWERPGCDAHLLAQAAPAFSRHGEYRLSQTRIDSPEEPETCALHVQLALPEGLPVLAPFAGTVRRSPRGDLWLQGEAGVLLSPLAEQVEDGVRVAAGDWLGRTGPQLTVQLCRLPDLEPPLFARPSTARAWLSLCPAPDALLGVATQAPPLPDADALLARRDATFARSQKHYYQAPPQIERGWRNHLIDMTGRSYLDMLNNVATLGHGHPRMVEVAGRQWSLLNTNSRFHYAAIAEFSERLLAHAPAGMDRVYLVNSGSEANDLAIRLAWAASGGRDMLSVLEAYHGWTVACDAVSTSIADNPQALETRPDWVHPVLAPNTYRGLYRGDDSTADYMRDVDRQLAAVGDRQLAGFICEPVYGNAGGISLPPGYLEQVYAKVRKRGGVCIADEVQVGYGRLGEYFWGFEQQGVVPDIITIAKGMGNGHPLGAVITRREIAEALEAEGYFFSSAGGSPVSCRIGLAVLDVMAEEGLWDNARDTGRHFRARLEELVERFPLAGAVHGSGFYLGLELVRDRQTLEPATAETALLCERLRELGIFMQPTGDHLNILKIKPPMCTTRQSVDFFVDSVAKVLAEDL